MSEVEPWDSGFLANVLITYLEDRHPEAEWEVSCRRILSSIEGLNDVRDPKAFLRDPNRWIPHRLLHELMILCEEVSQSKDAAYEAAIHYFQSHPHRLPTFLEILIKVVQDVRGVLVHGDSWAAAHTNYLHIQCIPLSPAEREVILLARFDPCVHPRFGSFGLIRGNFEGFARFYDFVDDALCEPVAFQMSIEQLVSELGGHRIRRNDDKTLTIEDDSCRVVGEAEMVPLAYEAFPKFPVETGIGGAIAQEEPGGFRVISTGPRIEKKADTEVVRIVRGGILRHNGIGAEVKSGWIFGAPYTRFRMTWREVGDSIRAHVGRNEREIISSLLVSHVQESRRRLPLTGDPGKSDRVGWNEKPRSKEFQEQDNRFGPIIGRSEEMRHVFRFIQMVSKIDSTILITGETGTGKEVVARAIHSNSPRKERRFVAINCGAVVESLLESELFGHEKGAFTGAIQQRMGKFEQAHQGTLFLDEISEISPSVQVKLLRVLQEREIERVGGSQTIPIDVRVIAATNQDLSALVAAGKFRMDLYYRIHVIPIDLPPLRERSDDIPLLVEHLLERWKRKNGRVPVLPPDLERILLRYDWPGNVRELENVMERMVILSDGENVFQTIHLPAGVVKRSGEEDGAGGAFLKGDRNAWVNWTSISSNLMKGMSLNEVIVKIEREIIQQAVKDQGGNKSRAARFLKRSYRWLRKVEKEWDRRPQI